MPGLTGAVHCYRLQLMREFMRTRRYDALAFTSADWFEWAGNHPISDLAWERPFLLVVPLNGKSFAVAAEIGRHQLAAEERRGTLWIDSVIQYRESPGGAPRAWQLPQWGEMVADTLTAAGLHRSRICADALPRVLAQAARSLPGLSITAEGEALRALRWIKHEEELTTMRIAASLSDWAMDSFREEIRPGRLTAEIDYQVASKLAGEAARRVPEENFVINRVFTLSGPVSACPHGDGALTGKVVEKNAVAVTTIVARLNGLAVELARSWLVGRPDERSIALFDCALAAQTAGIEAAHAGAPVCSIHASAHRVIERAGFQEYFGIRSGHGIGVVMHDFPHDYAFEQRSLLKGETYVIEPGLYVPEVGGFRSADLIAVGAGAPEQITKCSNGRAAQTLA